MASLNHIYFGILILHIYAYAAPSDVGKLEDIAKVDTTDVTPTEVEPIQEDIENDGTTTETSRQKRQFYNPYGYGFPPISKIIYPSSFNNRDNFDNFGSFGVEDPLLQIHKRVQEIASFVRQPPPPPPIPQVPIFFPVLFVPSFDCGCNPTDPTPTGPPTTDNNTMQPNVTNRFPEMEDERQNWGIVTEDSTDANENDDEGQDFSRPISFDPIKLDRPNARPPPPVDHGTVQSEAGNSVNPQSPEDSRDEVPPPPPSTRPPPPPTTQNPLMNGPQRPPPRRPPVGFSPTGPPTPCDGAILTCCHQAQVAYDCFAIQGCSSFTPYGNPCETNTILRIIEKFQNFYYGRNG